MEEKINKKELLEHARMLAEKHNELKILVTNILDEMDKNEHALLDKMIYNLESFVHEV